jgi:transcriptional regulator with XRE-family HTH domain
MSGPGPDAEYVKLLNEARMRAGHPPLREIAEQAGASHTHVSDVLNGATWPSLRRLRPIIDALTDNPEVVDAILRAYERAQSAPKRAPTSGELIAAAIRDAGDAIAKAIRELRERGQ